MLSKRGNRHIILLITSTMSMLDKFRQGAQKAGIQATAFLQDSGSKVANSSKDFAQGFSLPGEADKAAKILESFLGMNYSLSQIVHLLILLQPIPATQNLLSTRSLRPFYSGREVCTTTSIYNSHLESHP
jgi:hypothetical protein